MSRRPTVSAVARRRVSAASPPAPAAPVASPSDEALVRRVLGGDRRAWDVLLGRHEPWIYNLAFYMLQLPQDAEDATQEILLKITAGLASFRGNAAFRTWAWRLAVNHILDRRRSRAEETVHGFACFADYLGRTPDEPLEARAPRPDEALLVEEARRTCTVGMLLCLDRPQRLALLLGEILELEDVTAAEILGVSRAAFRQRLARARRDLKSFLAAHCGLVDPRNPCRCARKTAGFIKQGVVDPQRLVFTDAHRADVGRAAPRHARELKVLEHTTATTLRELYGTYPAPGVATRLASKLASLLTPSLASLASLEGDAP